MLAKPLLLTHARPRPTEPALLHNLLCRTCQCRVEALKHPIPKGSRQLRLVSAVTCCHGRCHDGRQHDLFHHTPVLPCCKVPASSPRLAIACEQLTSGDGSNEIVWYDQSACQQLMPGDESNQSCSVRQSEMENAIKSVLNASLSNCSIARLVEEGGGRDRGQQTPYRLAPAFHPLTFQF
eukprot:662027-Pelagomonas_calceolata.AAC.3